MCVHYISFTVLKFSPIFFVIVGNFSPIKKGVGNYLFCLPHTKYKSLLAFPAHGILGKCVWFIYLISFLISFQELFVRSGFFFFVEWERKNWIKRDTEVELDILQHNFCNNSAFLIVVLEGISSSFVSFYSINSLAYPFF